MSFSIVIMFLIGGLSQVHSHATEVRTCLTTTGMRIFVEHWHSGTPPANTGTMTIQANHEPGAPSTPLIAAGHVYDTAPGSLPGCRSGESDALVLSCELVHNNWVYYDFPITCGVPVEYTLISGQTIVLTEGCTELYPAVIQGTFACATPTTAPATVPSRAPSATPTAAPAAVSIRAPTRGPTSGKGNGKGSKGKGNGKGSKGNGNGKGSKGNNTGKGSKGKGKDNNIPPKKGKGKKGKGKGGRS